MNDSKLELFDEKYRPLIKQLHAQPMAIDLYDSYLSEKEKEILAELQELQVVREDDGFFRLTEAISKILRK